MKLSELILDLHINSIKPIRKVALSYNLTLSQLLCIVSIPYDGISQTELANKLSLDISTLSRNLSNLINKDIIVKNKDSLDGRAYNISLTSNGNKLYKNIYLDINEEFYKILNQLDIHDTESLSLGVENLNWLFVKNNY
tara:strand:- start:283 stop:699 length:417 start_codon:yes stop_codon:yes gene_type:complete